MRDSQEKLALVNTLQARKQAQELGRDQHKDGDLNISLIGELVSAGQNELSPGGEAGR